MPPVDGSILVLEANAEEDGLAWSSSTCRERMVLRKGTGQNATLIKSSFRKGRWNADIVGSVPTVKGILQDRTQGRRGNRLSCVTCEGLQEARKTVKLLHSHLMLVKDGDTTRVSLNSKARISFLFKVASIATSNRSNLSNENRYIGVSGLDMGDHVPDLIHAQCSMRVIDLDVGATSRGRAHSPFRHHCR